MAGGAWALRGCLAVSGFSIGEKGILGNGDLGLWDMGLWELGWYRGRKSACHWRSQTLWSRIFRSKTFLCYQFPSCMKICLRVGKIRSFERSGRGQGGNLGKFHPTRGARGTRKKGWFCFSSSARTFIPVHFREGFRKGLVAWGEGGYAPDTCFFARALVFN